MNRYSKILVVFVLFSLHSNVCSAQFRGQIVAEKSGLTNLDFELGNPGEKPENWTVGNGSISGAIGINKNRKGSYHVSLDGIEKHSGNLSLKMGIDIRNNKKFGYFSSMLSIDPKTVKTVEFKGWIKTQDIKKGYAGLTFYVDGEVIEKKKKKNKTSYFAPTISSDKTRLTGNNDWTQVSIKMDISEKAASIGFGGQFTGEGTAWFDNLELYINGEKYVDSAKTEQNVQQTALF
jgi:erythromycin esterase